MSTRIGHGVILTLLLAGGCGSSNGTAGVGTAGNGSHDPGTAGGGGTGASGGAASNAGAGGGAGAGAATGAGGTAGGGGVSDAVWLTPPEVPPALVPPQGATVKLHGHAVGAQIYTCTASAGASADGGADADAGAPTYAWVLKAPDAKLYDSTGTQVGTHGAGPSWTWRDGSVANGKKVAELAAPASGAISWLLLRVTSTSGAGMLADATYVQRLNTAGGTPPATGCDSTTVGTDTRADYSADYYFYSGGGAAAWLTPPAVPSDIAVPTDVRLALHDHAIGVQIYNCAATAGAADAGAPTYAWVFKAPDALLYDLTFTPVATHGAGPSWTSTDGSVINAAQIARADAPRAGAIPWLLLKEVSTSGPGVFSDIAFIQRVNTAGGAAPATGCDASTADTVVRVAYSADYYFYVSINQPDAAAGG